MEDIDFRTPRGLDRSVIMSLAQASWVAAHHNLLITGPTGAGKSTSCKSDGTRRECLGRIPCGGSVAPRLWVFESADHDRLGHRHVANAWIA